MHANSLNMTSDGLALSPAEYAKLLTELSESGKLAADNYGIGGNVIELEAAMAELLGKEAAIVMPTGTMANLLAVQYLATGAQKIIVQQASHLYNDSGDCSASLAGLQLMPLGKRATFSANDVHGVLNRIKNGKSDSPLGVISIESPVRRLDGEMFDPAALDEVIEMAGERDIRLHLDGARLPVMSAYTGKSLKSLSMPFDTIYVSLYKCFNSLSGGVLAGDRKLIQRLGHWRRRNGGGMAQLWPIAAVALHYLPGVVDRLVEAVKISEAFFNLLNDDGRFIHTPVSGGSSVSRIKISGTDRQGCEKFRRHLLSHGVVMPGFDGDPCGFSIKVNESWRHRTPEELFMAFQSAADSARISR
ncbi:MAG: beta-eliminating lyase-related protein [Rhizobiaceae bacterium]